VACFSGPQVCGKARFARYLSAAVVAEPGHSRMVQVAVEGLTVRKLERDRKLTVHYLWLVQQ